jgi:DNA-binding XRE family transcriptional regulator
MLTIMITRCIIFIKEVCRMVNNKLREIRMEIGMSISELARRAKTSRQTITNIELYGQVPNGLLMISICDVLRKEPKEIFFDDNVSRGSTFGYRSEESV